MKKKTVGLWPNGILVNLGLLNIDEMHGLKTLYEEGLKLNKGRRAMKPLRKYYIIAIINYKNIHMKTYKILFLLSAVLIFTACNQTQKEQTIAEDSQEMNIFFGDLHNHCNLTYGHGDMRDAFEAAKQQLDFVSVTPHAMWPDIPGKDDPRLGWVIDYHVDAFKRLRESGWKEYVKMTNEYNKEGEFVTFLGYEIHSMKYGDHVALNYDLDAQLLKLNQFLT